MSHSISEIETYTVQMWTSQLDPSTTAQGIQNYCGLVVVVLWEMVASSVLHRPIATSRL